MPRPPYMNRRQLVVGWSWFFEPPTWARKAGCPVKAEPLGPNYEQAKERVESLLYPQFRAWRTKRKLPKILDNDRRFGTLDWLFERAQRTRRFEKPNERTRASYRVALTLAANTKVKRGSGGTLGACHVKDLAPVMADDAYGKLLTGPKGKRYRTANLSFDIARHAWNTVRRLYPDTVPALNPFEGVTRERQVQEKPHATYRELCDLIDALAMRGHTPLAVAALICFWWHQRPENVLDGHITWADYRPPDRPDHVKIFHHKTGKEHWLPLGDEDGSFYPELEQWLKHLPRLGVPVVLNTNDRGPDRRYSHSYARRRVREARRWAGIAEHVTLDACRHGGLTLLGDAGATAVEIRAKSAHGTMASLERYVKKTDPQKVSASRKGRARISGTKSGDLSE